MIKSKSAKVGDGVFILVCVLVSLICIVPMLNLLARSFSSTEALIKHEVYLWPKGWNLDAYATVLSDMKWLYRDPQHRLRGVNRLDCDPICRVGVYYLQHHQAHHL